MNSTLVKIEVFKHVWKNTVTHGVILEINGVAQQVGRIVSGAVIEMDSSKISTDHNGLFILAIKALKEANGLEKIKPGTKKDAT